MEGRARLTDRATPLIHAVQDGVLRDLMTQRLAESIRMDRDRLEKRLTPTSRARTPSPPTPTAGIDPSRSPVRMIIALLLARPALCETGPEAAELLDIQRKGADLMCDLLEICRTNPNLNTAALLERFRGHRAHGALQRLAAWDLGFKEESQFQEEYRQTMGRLQAELTQQHIDTLLAIPKAPLREDQADELRRLMASKRGH